MPEIEQRIRVLIALGKLPTEQAVKDMEEYQWKMLAFFIKKYENDNKRWLSELLQQLLGNVFKSEDVNLANRTRYLGDPDDNSAHSALTRAFYPLSHLIAPELVDRIKKSLSPTPAGLDTAAEPFFTRKLGLEDTRRLSHKKAQIEGYEMSKKEFIAATKHIMQVAKGKQAENVAKRKKWEQDYMERKAKETAAKNRDSKSKPPSKLRRM